MISGKFLAAAFGAALLSAGVAQAADLPYRKGSPEYTPPPPVFTWTGGYLGSIVGIAFLDGRADPRCTTRTGAVNAGGCPILPSERLRSTGFLFGATSGYNLQFSQVVLGIESDIQGTDLGKTSTLTGRLALRDGHVSPAGTTIFAREQIDAFGTVRGRLGFAWNRALLYVTGGLIYANVNYSTRQVFPAPANNSYIGHSDSLRFGAVVGGGIEYAFTDRWSAKVEGLYYDLGSKTVQPGETLGHGGHLGDRFRTDGELFRVGLNYKFGSLW